MIKNKHKLFELFYSLYPTNNINNIMNDKKSVFLVYLKEVKSREEFFKLLYVLAYLKNDTTKFRDKEYVWSCVNFLRKFKNYIPLMEEWKERIKPKKYHKIDREKYGLNL